MPDDLNFQCMIDTLQGAFIMADSADMTVMAANQLASIQLGLPLPELMGQPLARFVSKPPLGDILRDIQRQDLLYNIEGEICSARGRCFPVLLSARVVAWSYPTLIFTFSDHSQQQLMNELLKKKDELFERVRQLLPAGDENMAEDPDDYISGVLSAGQLLERAGIEVGHARRYHNPLAALQIHAEVVPIHDKAPLGAYNRTHFRRMVSYLCVQSSRDGDLVGRHENGTLVMLLRQTTLQDAVRVAKRLQQRLGSFAFWPDGANCETSTCIGISTWNEADRNARQLQVRLEAALTKARLTGRNTIVSLS
ncbi:GGDEF domain-containing protein [Vogesella fluminis]|uniref:GGDEF domain-containing protein n=2 Tax=Vogesella fluminis TaxID=1069161 RepID=A0ABQ3H7V2_9NEIS|nr:diguanylate cyclase [Vogesella fluminis]GHD71630.1 hypothetical protein GCM10011419_03670 [Vogesella fluminis]